MYTGTNKMCHSDNYVNACDVGVILMFLGILMSVVCSF